jgi:amino-acid N-acetyltransferase
MSRVFFTAVPRGHYDVLRLSLDAAQLPTDDLMDDDLAFFMLSDEFGPIGFVGLQGTGADRLLRSLVVLPSRKRKGNGGL